MVDLFTSHLYIHSASSSSSSSSSQLAPSVPISHSSSSLTNFPIIAIAVIGILATAFLLVSYYIIAIKCCLDLHRVSITQDRDDTLMMQSPANPQQPKGLDQSAINSIPIVEFNKASLEPRFQECSVCLGEFQVNEKLRCLQDCSHLFHLDCIDVWLQNNANCPLCRTSISYANPSTRRPPRHDLAIAETTTCDFVVIEIRQQQQLQGPDRQPIIRHHPHDTPKKLGRMKQQVVSMGDECIDVRVKDDVFKIQPIRRSISMDSSNDRQLYWAVQDVQHQKKCSNVNEQGCSSSSRFKRSSFFSFGSGRCRKGVAYSSGAINMSFI